MTDPLLIAIAVAHLIAFADVWTSRLTRTAKVLWTLTLIFLFGVGMFAWLLTRHSAHEDPEPLPAPAE
jgi:drug/metabolite transporter (DMT)-like permease